MLILCCAILALFGSVLFLIGIPFTGMGIYGLFFGGHVSMHGYYEGASMYFVMGGVFLFLGFIIARTGVKHLTSRLNNGTA